MIYQSLLFAIIRGQVFYRRNSIVHKKYNSIEERTDDRLDLK